MKDKIKENYNMNITRFSDEAEQLNKTSKIIGLLRLIVFIIGVGAGFAGNLLLSPLFGVLLPLPFLGFFIFLVVKHNATEELKDLKEALVKVNRESLDRLDHKWAAFPDSGEDLRPEHHAYAGDLDIFGPSSLFQLINTTETAAGRNYLKETLLNPETSGEKIKAKQEGVKELAEKLSWRQMFQGLGKKQKNKTEEGSFSLKEALPAPDKKLKLLSLLPFISIPIALFFGLIYKFYTPGILLALVHIVILWRYNKSIAGELAAFESLKKELKGCAGMLKHFENEPFSSPILKEAKEKITNNKDVSLTKQAEMLFKILNNSDIRYNAIYFVINIGLLWDLKILIDLRKWYSAYGDSVSRWEEILGLLETLCSFAQLKYNNPDWCFPQINSNPGYFMAKDLGHPLLDDKRVVNDMNLNEAGTIHLITGSNMSGKSTWLRTTGINLIMASCGAPVCAAKLNCSLAKVYTVMRIRDDLENGISSFYAELIRIKKILTSTDKNIFFLLDEIFKGTNSIDRHTGARVLCLALSRRNASGLVSTHDLELGKLSEENPKIKNYHFKEHYEENSLLFDYKLIPGISETRNALFLMKMMGMEELL